MSSTEKGKYVSRAAFAKMQGERDRLKKDIYTMVMGSMPDAILVKEKWRKKFNKDKWFWEGLKRIAKEYPDLTDPKIDSNPKAFK